MQQSVFPVFPFFFPPQAEDRKRRLLVSSHFQSNITSTVCLCIFKFLSSFFFLCQLCRHLGQPLRHLCIVWEEAEVSEVMYGWSNAFVPPPPSPPEMVQADKRFSRKIELHWNNSQFFDVLCLTLVIGQFRDSVCDCCDCTSRGLLLHTATAAHTGYRHKSCACPFFCTNLFICEFRPNSSFSVYLYAPYI